MTVAVPLDLDRLASALQTELPRVVFAYLHGSAAAGVVPPHSDLDIALYVERAVLDSGHADAAGATSTTHTTQPLDTIYAAVNRVVESLAPGARCDIGILNTAEPVFRFEVLKGRLLFCRDQEQWLHFYSFTCRQYESRLFHYEKQHRYRIEARQ